MQTAPDERTIMLKAAVAACFKAREPVTPTNIRKRVPEDFFLDFDTGEPLDDATVFAEIQSTYTHVAHAAAAMIETNPEGHKLAPVPVESFPDYLPPSEKIEPVEDVTKSVEPHAAQSVEPHPPVAPVAEIAAPIAAGEHVEAAPAEQSGASHAASAPGQSPQARLDAARKRESGLLSERSQLQAAQRAARSAVAEAVRAFQVADPHRQTPAELSAEYRATSQATRAARAQAPGPIAYVDLERKYSQGGDANAMARRMNVTGNRRGAYSRQSLGQVNRDISRGPVPKPVATRATIPALSK
jgi:hypothetical protein